VAGFNYFNAERAKPDFWEKDHSAFLKGGEMPPAPPYLLEIVLNESEKKVDLHHKMMALFEE